MTPTVTFTGSEVALVAGLIATSLPALDQADFDVADLMLDRALAALPRPLAADVEARIARLRDRPHFPMEDTNK
jgi:hypothetical protein